MIVVGPPPLTPLSTALQQERQLEPKKPPPPRHEVIGELTGESQRSVKVKLNDTEEEEIWIDGEKGPLSIQLNGSMRLGAGSGVGRFKSGQIGHEGSKAWEKMGRTERECWLVTLAKRQRAMRERQGLPFSTMHATGAW
eukprot:CAMPEP_0171097370 /NCGR_PEP_ID=MMETSP0766_2-20121228/47506_1 /TAXON_ID=439317 /ORGANISM="Gambierdiscus australes, Strain CAWD 149" /LENGTH=138 /DNA_ID=CAMNT_0011556555 /DNA_START=72 /DNA_END=485 /DNA_ORIENTATION=+